MFHSTALKLTVWYIAIIMALSLGCSLVIYHISSADLARDASRQVQYFNNYLGSEDFITYRALRNRQLALDQSHLRTDLIVFNLLVLVGGGAISYLSARRTLRPIEDALESQKRFSADASHELRTPLATIKAETEVALRDPKLNKKKAAELLRSNLEEINRLTSLSEGLLRLAETGKRPQVSNRFAAATMAEEAIARLKKVAEAKNIRISQSVNPATIGGDQQSLTDAVVILLDNAIKYSPASSRIEISGGKSGKHFAQVSVKDQGIGIKRAELPRIFERFYRADSSRGRESAGGYGLGLAIAKKTVEMHHGHIEVISAPNKGSTFTIYLPLAKVKK